MAKNSLFVDFEKTALIPVITQDANTHVVLMCAFTNREAWNLTRVHGYAYYYSRSRGRIWKKGEESGNVQKIVQICVDCDHDTLLYQVIQSGAACHTGHQSCFYRHLADDTWKPIS